MTTEYNIFSGEEVELHLELRKALETGKFGEMIKHPLGQTIFYDLCMYKFFNDQLEAKEQAAKAAIKERDFNKFVYLHERPWRWSALHCLEEAGYVDLHGELFWELFLSIWTDTENWIEYREIIKSWLDEAGYMMRENEIEKREVEVFRGWHRAGGFDGYSWTVERPVAEFFSQRFRHADEENYLAIGKLDTSKSLAFIEDRNESEYFVPTCDVDVETILVGGEHKFDRWWSFDFDQTLHKTEIDPELWDDDNPDVLEPNMGLIELLKAVSKDGAGIQILTGRSSKNMLQVEQVLAFCRKFKIPVDKVVFAGSQERKHEILREGNAAFHYDDSPQPDDWNCNTVWSQVV